MKSKFRLIRFSENNEVVLDAQVDKPNEHGCNTLWREHSGGTAFIYDYATKRKRADGTEVEGVWYKMVPKDTKSYIAWIPEYDMDAMPDYIRMLALVGAI